MPISTISQNISTIPEAGHRGVDVQTQFVIKQEDFQDHLQGTTVPELNALKTQINTTVSGMNDAVTNVNTKASEAAASALNANNSASTATTKAGEASTSASQASASATKASQWADNNYNVEVETGKYSAKHWSTVAQNTVNNKIDKIISTDNAIVRFNGTTGDVQNSGVIIDDNGNITQNGTTSSQFSLNVGGNLKGWIYSGTAGTALTSIDYLTLNTNNIERVRIDSAGNAGIGVIPSAWGSGFNAIEGNSGSVVYRSSNSGLELWQNAYFSSGANVYKTTAAASRYAQQGGQHVWYTAPSGTAGNTITWKNAMILNASGNLGIGVTPSAWYTTNVKSIENNWGFLADTGGNMTLGFNAYVNSSNVWVSKNGQDKSSTYVQTSGNHRWYSSPSAAADNALSFVNTMTLYQSGELLTQFTGVANSVGYMTRSASAAGAGYYHYVGQSNGVDVIRITGNGNVTNINNSYGALSDAKLKENVINASPKLDKLMQIRVVNYNLIGDTTKQIGVIAQELEKIFPSLVEETKDTEQVEVTKTRDITDEEGNVTTEEYTETETVETGEVTKNVKYSVIYMMMLKGMQEMNAKIEAMQLEIDMLKGAK